MNVNDTEIAWSILQEKGYHRTTDILEVYCIGKTCPCNVYPLKPHFHIEKLGNAGVYLIFLFLLKNIDYSKAVLTCTYNLCFEQK